MACEKVTWERETLQAHGERLLPEIPDDVTLNLIAPKLAWRDICILSCVSRQWLHAIQSQEVSEARIRSHSTETLVFLTHTRSDYMKVISLYAKKSGAYFSEILEVPCPPCGMDPRDPKCVFLEGKIYVLGGDNMGSANDEVYVMDILGKRQWKRCARMITARAHFGCGASERKIYVFGGESNSFQALGSSEVYDPKEDTWSPIRQPMTCLRYGHRVESKDEELVLHSGYYFDGVDYSSTKKLGTTHNGGRRFADFLEVYHPKKEEWRVVSPFRSPRGESFFLVRGKLHSLSYGQDEFGIYIHDAEENSWKHLHSFSSLDWIRPAASTIIHWIGPVASTMIGHVVVVPLDDELLAIVLSPRGSLQASHFFQSRGFGKEKREIVWQKVQFSGRNRRPNSPEFMCSIQL